jgi:hypothetical protein
MIVSASGAHQQRFIVSFDGCHDARGRRATGAAIVLSAPKRPGVTDEDVIWIDQLFGATEVYDARGQLRGVR